MLNCYECKKYLKYSMIACKLLSLLRFNYSKIFILLVMFLTIYSCNFNNQQQKSIAKQEKSMIDSDLLANQINIVGSSTISPFMATISEEFIRKNNSNIMPIIDSTGTKKGIELFCLNNQNLNYDIVIASRKIKSEEISLCNKNNIKNIIEITLGYDGLVLATSIRNQNINLSKEQIFLALAEKIFDNKSKKIIDNPYKKWSEIDQNLPNKKIKFYAPPLTSGTREIFNDIAIEEICLKNQQFIAAYPDFLQRINQCKKIRQDGIFIESGENDNLIIDHLKKNKDAIGIVGFNFLVKNNQYIKPIAINSVLPSYKTINNKEYLLSRPLFLYFKREAIKSKPELRNFILEVIDKETIGKEGYLVHSGLIANSEAEMNKNSYKIKKIIKHRNK